MNNKLKIILPILLVSSSAFVLFQIKKDSTVTIPNSTSSNSSSIESNDQIITPTPFQKLDILSNRCISCGKCARIDAAHFSMNGRLAVVISSNNLNSANLVMAINNCPVQAITLQ